MTPAGLEQLKRDEGCRLHAYGDPRTGAEPWTIGYGCTGADAEGHHIGKDTAWTLAKADTELLRRVAGFERNLASALPWIHTLSDARQDVLTNMAFNLGVDGLLGFKNTLASIQAGRYGDAADRMLQSAWAHQVGARSKRLSDIMRRGQ